MKTKRNGPNDMKGVPYVGMIQRIGEARRREGEHRAPSSRAAESLCGRGPIRDGLQDQIP